MEYEDRLYQPLEYLEKFAENVLNNQFNDMGEVYLIAYRELILGLARCGAFKSVEDYQRGMDIFDQLQELFKDQ